MSIAFQTAQTDIVVAVQHGALAALVNDAARRLASAQSAAEFLDVVVASSVAYDATKKAARFLKAKGHADELIGKAHRAQADALEIEAAAKRRLADEYDAAQERGEVRSVGNVPEQNNTPTVEDIGLTRKDIYEARQIRDAEENDPGIVRRTLDEKLAAGEEPTKASLREAVLEAARQGLRGTTQQNRNPHYQAPTKAGEAWTKLYGTCRAMTEWATDENIALAVRGRTERTDDQQMNIRAVRRAAEVMSEIVRKIDAH